MTTSVKIFADLFRGIFIDRLIERDDAAECADRIGCQRFQISLGERTADRHAAWIGMLDDGDSRNFASNSETSSNAASVSLMLLYESSLPCSCRAVATPTRAAIRNIKRRRLMRILAIAQRLRELAAESAPLGRRRADLAREPIADRRIVGRRARKRLGCELLCGTPASSRRRSPKFPKARARNRQARRRR